MHFSKVFLALVATAAYGNALRLNQAPAPAPAAPAAPAPATAPAPGPAAPAAPGAPAPLAGPAPAPAPAAPKEKDVAAVMFRVPNMKYHNIHNEGVVEDMKKALTKVFAKVAGCKAAAAAPAPAPAAGPAPAPGAPAPAPAPGAGPAPAPAPAPAFIQQAPAPAPAPAPAAGPAAAPVAAGPAPAPGAAPGPVAGPAPAAKGPSCDSLHLQFFKGSVGVKAIMESDKPKELVKKMQEAIKAGHFAEEVEDELEEVSAYWHDIFKGVELVDVEAAEYKLVDFVPTCAPHIEKVLKRFTLSYTRRQVPFALDASCHSFMTHMSFTNDDKSNWEDKFACKDATRKLMSAWSGGYKGKCDGEKQLLVKHQCDLGKREYKEWCKDVCLAKYGAGALECGKEEKKEKKDAAAPAPAPAAGPAPAPAPAPAAGPAPAPAPAPAAF